MMVMLGKTFRSPKENTDLDFNLKDMMQNRAKRASLYVAQNSKGFTCNVGDLSLIPGSGRSPGEGNGYPLQYSCLENPMDRGAWWTTVHGVSKSQT